MWRGELLPEPAGGDALEGADEPGQGDFRRVVWTRRCTWPGSLLNSRSCAPKSAQTSRMISSRAGRDLPGERAAPVLRDEDQVRVEAAGRRFFPCVCRCFLPGVVSEVSAMLGGVKIVVQVKLLPDASAAPALEATLRAVNDAANMVSAVAFDRRVFREYDLRRHVYGDLEARGLGAQAAQHVIRKTCHAYKALKAGIRAGNLGKAGSRRRARAESKPIRFRPDAAQPFDDRCLSWQVDARTVLIWTTSGRLRGIRFACSAAALETLAACRRGESDLVRRDGKWFLIATCDIPEPQTRGRPGSSASTSGSRTSRPPATARSWPAAR